MKSKSYFQASEKSWKLSSLKLLAELLGLNIETEILLPGQTFT